MPSTRRMFVAASLSVVSGCTLSGSGEQESTVRSDTETRSTHNPDKVLGFGEPYVDTDLEITVEEPNIRTTFRHDGEEYQMPDGDAVALTPVIFHNTHEEELRPIDGPLFTLVTGGTTTLETHSIKHPEFSPTVKRRELEGVTTTLRWSAEGGSVSPGEEVTGTAAFRISESVNVSDVSIVYEAERIKYDSRFGDTVVAWRQ